MYNVIHFAPYYIVKEDFGYEFKRIRLYITNTCNHGAINWGLIGFFRFDLVAFLFGNMSWLSRIIYALVGISGLYLLSAYGRIRSIEQA